MLIQLLHVNFNNWKSGIGVPRKVHFFDSKKWTFRGTLIQRPLTYITWEWAQCHQLIMRSYSLIPSRVAASLRERLVENHLDRLIIRLGSRLNIVFSFVKDPGRNFQIQVICRVQIWSSIHVLKRCSVLTYDVPFLTVVKWCDTLTDSEHGAPVKRDSIIWKEILTKSGKTFDARYNGTGSLRLICSL